MILDHLTQWPRYASLGLQFEQAFRHLAGLTPDAPVGRFAIAGNDVFALVQTYPTKMVTQCRFEAHRQYADVQFILAGQERILWAPLTALTSITEPYDAGKDIAFYGMPAAMTPLFLEAGHFAVFFPTDGHAPGAAWNQSVEVRKVVVKIRV